MRPVAGCRSYPSRRQLRLRQLHHRPRPAEPTAGAQGCSAMHVRPGRPACRARHRGRQEPGRGQRDRCRRTCPARSTPPGAAGRCLAARRVPARPDRPSADHHWTRLAPGHRQIPARPGTAAPPARLPGPRHQTERRWSERCAGRPERRNHDRRREGRRRRAPGGDGRRTGPQVFRDDQPYVGASTPPRHVARAAQTSAGCRLPGRTKRSGGSTRSFGRPRRHRPGTPRVREPSARALGWP